MSRVPAPARTSFLTRLGRYLAATGILLLLAILLIDWLVLLDSGLVDPARWSLAPEAFVELIRGWGAWGVAGSLALMVLHSFVPFPAECLAIANGMVFGFLWGSVITWSGAMLGALLAFGLARWLGQPFVQRRLSVKHWERVEHWSHAHGWSTLLTARLVPVIAFNLINYAAGLTSVSWRTFTWTTAVGILPLTLLMVLLGERMTAMPAWAWLLTGVLALGVWLLLHRLKRTRPAQLQADVESADG